MAIITPEYLAKSGTEHGEQTALFCWANHARLWGFDIADDMASYGVQLLGAKNAIQRLAPAPVQELEWLYAIPNGGWRGMAQGGALKAEGVKSGVADIHLPLAMEEAHGLYIEMKKANGVPSNVSEDQYKFGAFVTLKGFDWYVAFGWQQAARIIRWYFNQRTTALLIAPHQTTVHNRMMEIANGR